MRDDLLDLVMRDPAAATVTARRVLRESRDLRELAQAERTLGVASRDGGQFEEAFRHLRTALHRAETSGDQHLKSDIRASYGATLVVAGRFRAGIAQLSRAFDESDGAHQATIAFRRGTCLAILGRYQSAISDFDLAVSVFRSDRDDSWLPRALNGLGDAQLALGRLDAASASFREAEAFYAADIQSVETAWLTANQALLRFLGGDLPAALGTIDSISVDLAVNQRLLWAITWTKVNFLLASAQVRDAGELLEQVDSDRLSMTDAAELLGLAADISLGLGNYAHALELSAECEARSLRLGSTLLASVARLTSIQASAAHGQAVDVARAVLVAEDLERLHSNRAPEAWVIAGRLSEPSVAPDVYVRGSHYRQSDNRLTSSIGWLATALGRDVAAEVGVLRACSRGLGALDEYREIVGSSELRASITHLGRELAELALRRAAHDPRMLLTWSERWRATSLAQSPVTPHGSVSPALAMLRDSGRRVAQARAAGESTDALEKERRSLERKVRAEHHQQRAEGKTETKRFNAAELVAQVGDGAFVELVDVDGILHVLVVSRGRVRRVIAGETKAALELAEAGRFALRRAARTGRFAPGDLGERFQEAVLGKAVRMLPDGPVTISPTAALHGAPFALMPALKVRPFSIVPSAAQWLRAREVPMPRTKRRALVSGPGLLTGGAEVARLAAEYPDATILRGADATVSNTMKAIDGAKLAHLATHGTFRADSPLFSALEMADGPLSVYELERLKRAPYRTILSACDSGVLAPVGAQEVLGLASALFSLGSAGLVCSIAEVNDEATADLMMQVHASLEAKRTPAEALAQVRESGSPVEQATAAAFVALGV